MSEQDPADEEPDQSPTPAPRRVIDRSNALGELHRNRGGGIASQSLGSLGHDLFAAQSALRSFQMPSTALREIERASRISDLAGSALHVSNSVASVMNVAAEEARRMREAARSVMTQVPKPFSSLREIEQATRTSDLMRTATLATEQASSLTCIAAREGRRLSDLADRLGQSWMVGSALSETARLVRASQSFIGDAVRDHLDMVGRVQRDLNKTWEAARALQPWRYAEQIRTLPKRVKKNLVAMAEAGWYLDSEMPISDLIHFEDELAESDPEQISAGRADYFEGALDRIEETLSDRHPNRAHLIRDSFEAHRAGKFNTSIPLLLTQADGICFDLTGFQLFTGRGLVKLVKRVDPDTIERAYLEPLLRLGPISEGARQRQRRPASLNRHAVLHGECTDFGTKENGLKAISFLNFVSFVLCMTSESASNRAHENVRSIEKN